jgi:hypothetical protein
VKVINSILDRGYQKREKNGITEIIMPITRKKESYNNKRKRQAECRSKANLEGLILLLKFVHKIFRNYLKGKAGN